jgi:hypothetical protein
MNIEKLKMDIYKKNLIELFKNDKSGQGHFEIKLPNDNFLIMYTGGLAKKVNLKTKETTDLKFDRRIIYKNYLFKSFFKLLEIYEYEIDENNKPLFKLLVQANIIDILNPHIAIIETSNPNIILIPIISNIDNEYNYILFDCEKNDLINLKE